VAHERRRRGGEGEAEDIAMSDQYDSFEEKQAAERQLRVAMAAEARAEREMREKIQKYFYIGVGVVVVLFIALMLFT
jgi:hypothetical protein